MIDTDEIAARPTVPTLLHRNVRVFGDREFLVSDVDRMTHREAEATSRHLARRLIAAGAGKGTRIGAQFPYGSAWITCWLAAARIGALFIPFSTAYKPPEFLKTLRHSDVQMLLMPAEMHGEDRQAFLEQAIPGLATRSESTLYLDDAPCLRSIWILDGAPRAWARPLLLEAMPSNDAPSEALLAQVESEVSPADLAVGIYTSGTTAEPKGVLHTQGALVRQGITLAKLTELKEDSRVFCGMPFFWVGGIGFTILPAMVSGAVLLCVDRTDPERCLDIMEREQATHIRGWPGVTGPMMSHPSLPGRKIPAFMRANEFASPGAVVKGAVHGSLGMTETLASHTLAGPEDRNLPVPEGLTGSMGPAVPGMENKIVDPETGRDLPDRQEGAILVRGRSLMAGMIKREREEVFTADGWYDTGDKGFRVGRLLFLTGRTKEMIKTSGNNVAPPEVEQVLARCSGVKQAYVLGIPDPQRGELVAAALVPKPDATLDTAAIAEEARRQLSNYKVPRRFVVMDEADVPWLASGKVDRLKIREILAARTT